MQLSTFATLSARTGHHERMAASVETNTINEHRVKPNPLCWPTCSVAVLELKGSPHASALCPAAEIDGPADRSHIIDHRTGLHRSNKRLTIPLEESIPFVFFRDFHLDRASARGVLNINECQMAIVTG